MAEQTIYINQSEILTITDNNYTNTIMESLVGPEGKTGPVGPPGPPGPRGPRGRAAPFFPRTVYVTQNLTLNEGSNIISNSDTTWIKINSNHTNSTIEGMNTAVEGELRILTNTGINTVIIRHNSTNAAANQKILLLNNQDISLSANNSIQFLYDQINNCWRFLSSNIGA